MKLVVKTMAANGDAIAKKLAPKLPDSSLDRREEGKFTFLTWTSRYQGISGEAKQMLWALENKAQAIKVIEMPEVK